MISIIVPIYNAELTLTKCINSIFSQEYIDWELILVDDGSKDNSLALCQDIKEGNNNIFVVHKDNGGLASARNTGLEYAKGEYICFIDSDDSVEKNYLSSLIENLEKYDSDISVCGFKFVNNGNITTSINTQDRCYNNVFNNEDFLLLFETGLLNSACNKLYKRKIIANNTLLFRDLTIVEDLDFNIRYFQLINKLSLTRTTPYNYVQDNSHLTKKISEDMFTNYINIHNTLYLLVDDKRHKLIDRFIYHQYLSFVIRYVVNIIHRKTNKNYALSFLNEILKDPYIKSSFKNYSPKSWKELIIHRCIQHRLFNILFLIYKIKS